MRKPTHADAELMLRLYEIRREPELRHARAWFLSEFKPAGWDEIKARWLSHADEDRYVRMTVSYWEMVGMLVARDVLHAELFFDSTGEDIVAWDRCKVWIDGARAHLRPNYLSYFEALVTAHQAYRAKGIEAFKAAQQRKAAAAAGGGAKVRAMAAAGGTRSRARRAR